MIGVLSEGKSCYPVPMSDIHVLPVALVNRIAAGEVVERPASVVKELVENAIDADPSRIDVVIEQGGQKLISVSDDGSGMGAADLALAFSPHATSKLNTDEDLFAIDTMGFRGEALASIASISHAHIRTRKQDDDGAHEISASGDSVEDVRPCASAPGTTVTIRDLFFNTPARRKFMRTVNTEFGHISEQLNRLALGHPQVAFTLTHNGREVQNLPAAESTMQRVRDLFGAELAESLLPFSTNRESCDIAGLIGPPSAARSSGKWQYFFLNGRYIRDRLLAHALKEAFRGLMDPRKFPVAFIFITLDPGDVDVNVHPTKIEVRFRNGQAVHGSLLASLKETLNKANLTPSATFETQGGKFGEPQSESADDVAATAQQQSLREALADFFKSAPPPQPRFSFPERQSQPAGASAEFTTGARPIERAAPIGRFESAPSPQPATHSEPAAVTTAEQAEAYSPPVAHRHAMQVHNSYIVTSDDDGIAVIDQHALHERIIYNDLKRRLADGACTSQRMLIPQPLTVTSAEAALLEEKSDLLTKLGIEVAQFGPAAVAVQRFPSLLAERGVAADQFIRDLLDQLGEDETAQPEKLIEDVLEMMACKAAVKAGDPLTAEEIDSLLTRADGIDKASSCPHGRPTQLKLTLKELEKQFKRT